MAGIKERICFMDYGQLAEVRQHKGKYCHSKRTRKALADAHGVKFVGTWKEQFTNRCDDIFRSPDGHTHYRFAM